MVARPEFYLDWTDGSPTKVTQPPPATLLEGWVPGEPLPPDYLNWLFWTTDQWIQYLDGNQQQDSSGQSITTNQRMLLGGLWSWVLSSGTLAWSAAFDISTPGSADADNQVAASSCVIADGSVAYVQANVPITVTCTTTSGSSVLTEVAEVNGIVSGQSVSGTGIAGGTTVSGTPTQQADGTYHIPISQNATANGTPSLTFVGTSAPTVQVSAIASLVPSVNTVVIARRSGNVVCFGINGQYFTLRDNEQRSINSAHGYAVITSATAGVNITAGEAVYISDGTDSLTAGRAYLCDASAAAGIVATHFAGFAISTVTAGNSVDICSAGEIVGLLPVGSPGLSAGAEYWVDPANPGKLTSTKPTNVAYYLIPVGIAFSTTTLVVNAATSGSVISVPGTGLGIGAGGLTIKDPGISGSYSILTSDDGKVFEVVSANGVLAFSLPAPASSSGMKFTIIDGSGSFDINAATLAPHASEKIQGLAATFSMSTPFGRWTFFCDGTNWVQGA